MVEVSDFNQSNRQAKSKGAPTPRQAIYPNTPAVMLHDLLTDGKSQPRSLGLIGLFRFYLFELFEDLVEVSESDAGAGILDGDDQFPA